MKLYSAAVLISICIVVAADVLCHTNVIRQRRFWQFQAVVFVLTLLTDSVISGRPYVYFSDLAISGFRVLMTPIENFIFGWSLISLNLITFEAMNKKLTKNTYQVGS